MSQSAQPPLGRVTVPYHRLLVAALLVAAIVPTVLLGGLTYLRLGLALAGDADARVARAADAASTVLARQQGELRSLAASYAGWPTLGRLVEQGDLDLARRDILDFLVQGGSLDGGLLAAAGRTVTSGAAPLQADLVRQGAAESSADELDSLATLSDGVYGLATATIHRSTDGSPIGRLLFARRLDARFAFEIRRLTGFDVAVIDDRGRIAVATDPQATAQLTAPGEGAATANRWISAWLSLDAGSGSGLSGRLLISTDRSALQVAGGQLPALTAALAAVTALLAAALSIWLARVLRQRLGATHEGLVALADGRIPPPLPPGRGDVADRLEAGLQRLVAALDRREEMLRRCLEAAVGLPTDLPVAQTATLAAAEARQIFGLTSCAIVDATGEVLGAAPGDPASADDAGNRWRRVEAIASLEAPVRWRLVGLTSADRDWSDGDEAVFRVMALLVGTVLRDAERYGEAAGRAARLDRVNQLQRAFLRSISHHLHTPLTTITLAAEDLVESAEGDAFAYVRAVAIRAEAARLRRLVEQVLILSRLEAGTVRLEGDAFSLGPLVGRVWRELGVERALRLDDRTAGMLALADGAATEQILWVLLDNATRYAPEGEIRVTIEPAHRRLGRRRRATVGPRSPVLAMARWPGGSTVLEVTVGDEGPGVPKAEQELIFRRFVRGSTAGGRDGMGLGLNIARSLARLMGGDVRYREQERGAGFVLSLPAGESDEPPLGARPTPSAEPGESTREG